MSGIVGNGFFGNKSSGPSEPFFTFKTTFEGEVSFSIVKTGEPAIWHMGDGTIYANTNAVTHTYANGSEKTVSVAVGDFMSVTALGSFANKAITEFDASQLNGLTSGGFNFGLNAGLSTFLAPTAITSMTGEIRFNNTALTSIDLSGIGSISGFAYYFHTCPSLTAITPPLSFNYSQVYMYSTALTAVNVSGWVPNNNWDLRFQANPNLTNFIKPSETTLYGTILNFKSCASLSSIDLSWCGTRWVREIYGQNCASLTSVIWPATNPILGITNYQQLRFDNCNITGILDWTWNQRGYSHPFGNFSFNNNPNLTEAHFNALSVFSVGRPENAFSNPSLGVTFNDCTSLTTLNLPVAIFNGGLQLINCSNLVNFTPPNSNTAAIQVNMRGCSSIVNLDLLWCKRFTVFIDLSNTPSLTNFSGFSVQDVLSTLTQAVYLQNSGISGHLDLSMLQVGGSVGVLGTSMPNITSLKWPIMANLASLRFENNAALNSIETTSWVSPAPAQNNTTYQFSGCSINENDINTALADIDAVAAGISGGSGANVFIRFEGGTNAAPTIGPPDGIAAKASLITKNYTVVTN